MAEYHFVNKTGYNITLGNSLELFELAPFGTLKIQRYQDSGKEIDPKYFIPPLINKGNGGATIKFNLIKCLEETFDTEHSPLNLNSYVNEGKIGERTYKFTYTFTEADYNRATTCP